MSKPLSNPIEEWVPSPEGRLFVKVWDAKGLAGGRPPIVLLHDSLGCVELWRGFPQRLGARTGRPVVAYDRSGFGRSDRRIAPISPDFIAQEAEHGFAPVCRHLGIGEFVLFGHSVGGGMAAHCAARFAARCEALVTESAQSFVEQRTVDGIAHARDSFERDGQLERLERYHGDKARWVLDSWTQTWLAPGFRSWNLDAALARVTCPVLVLHGEEDEYASRRQPERIAAGVAGPSRLELLTGLHHVPHREDEQAVVERVARFLEHHTAQARTNSGPDRPARG